jgi:nitrite reductase (NO-forming)
VTLTLEEAELEVAPGVRQKRWTFDGTTPGPTLHGRVGDTFVVTLVNSASMGGSSSHVVGSQLDTAWSEGSYLLRPGGGREGGGGGRQVQGLATAQGRFVELVPREPGRYPFATHLMADAERGARGILAVTR